MTLPGGPANKAGNRYERLWTVDQLLRLLDGRADSIRIEAPGVDKAEFVVYGGDVREWHQAKRNSPGGHWSVASLAEARVGVVQAMEALLSDRDTRFVFVSGSAAPELVGLCEAAMAAETEEEFVSAFLKAGVRRKAFERLRKEWRCETATIIAYLRRIEMRTVGHRELEDRVALFVRALFLADPSTVLRELEAVVEDSDPPHDPTRRFG